PLRREASVLLSRGATATAEVVQRVAAATLQKCRTMSEAPADPGDQERYKKMADVLRLMDKADRQEILTALEERDQATADAVKEYLYQFEDLLRIEDRSMQKLLSELDSKSLAAALKGAPEAIRDKVFGNLSKRARETLGEEMEFLGSVPPAQVQQAQQAVLEVIKRLDQAGELVML